MSNLDKLVDRVRLKEEGIDAVHQARSEGGRILGAACCREDKCGVAGLEKLLRFTDKIAHLVQIKFTTYKDDAIVAMCTGKLCARISQVCSHVDLAKEGNRAHSLSQPQSSCGGGINDKRIQRWWRLAHSIPLHSLSEKIWQSLSRGLGACKDS